MKLLFVVNIVIAINLHGYQRISHDTLLIGQRAHPRDRSRNVTGYAFLHLDRNSALAKAQSKMEEPIAKRQHFDRAQTIGLSSVSSAATACSMPIADGAVWKVSRGFFVNSRNTQQLSAAFLERAVTRAFRRWSCVLHGVERLVIGPLLGVRTDRDGNQINHDAPDGANEIGLARIDGRPDTVALTVLYGIFDGPIEQRGLVEFKMFFDQDHYRFGNSSERRGVIDFESTATHESGHAMGLDDIYSANCADVTMFGTSTFDEIKKRTLESPDIAGLLDLYD